MGLGKGNDSEGKKGYDCNNYAIMRLWWKEVRWCKCIVHKCEYSWDAIINWRASNQWLTKWCSYECSCNAWVRTHEWNLWKNQVGMQPGHNFIITTLSIAKFISETDIGGQPISSCPGSNVDDQATFHRGSVNFEILSSVILIPCPSYMNRCSEN